MKGKKIRLMSYVYILQDQESKEFTSVQLDIDISNIGSNLRLEKEAIKNSGKLLLGHPDYINCEILNVFPLDEMGYFKVKSKLVLEG